MKNQFKNGLEFVCAAFTALVAPCVLFVILVTAFISIVTPNEIRANPEASRSIKIAHYSSFDAFQTEGYWLFKNNWEVKEVSHAIHPGGQNDTDIIVVYTKNQ